ncbi:hypothetical protein [Pseudoalteromonas denitrificans]|uniref:Uncharacterized protein n=1 Tax=Pseudoalteromonas denitrificans DSM 6059 TaxID=1123010 RepID=A0A1I1PSJ6_9GAMM|nr:hypothetical protein [Pseudoalteromonas denitrificans]SFD12904.1 hypothetical protein SAMN02745724_03585 [Pseudoalteromonas denitrificans DSM 6059]
MARNVVYKHKKKYKLNSETLNRIQSVVLSLSDEIVISSLKDSSKTELKSVTFTTKNNIHGNDVDLELMFELSENEITEITLVLLDGPDCLNEIHLKYHVLDLLDEIIGGEHNGDLKGYTVRTYSKIFNSHPIRKELLINSDYKFLIKPFPWTSKQEPLTEQIIMFDIEVNAVNVEHARSLAYNHSLNVNTYLALLLDVGFEMINSEFRVFTIKQEDQFFLARHRTGFIDDELGVIVKDNHYGLKDVNDLDHVNSFSSGKTALNFAVEKSDGGCEFIDSHIYETVSNNDFLENLFFNHKIKKIKSNNRSKPEFIPISELPHYPVNEIKLPSEIRKYFKNISVLEKKAKEAFSSCCRMYNISLTLGKTQPTLEKSYKICAIEALASYEGLSFSEFMIKYSNDDFDKKISDYFYTVRSSHFHAGRFHFDEFAMNMQREISFTFKEKTEDYVNFSNYIRVALINWVKRVILS